jgi:hypothetical protein
MKILKVPVHIASVDSEQFHRKFIFPKKQPDVHLFEKSIIQFMHMVALTGFSQKDYMIAYDLDAGVNRCVTGKKEFMEKAYQIGKELLDPFPSPATERPG